MIQISAVNVQMVGTAYYRIMLQCVCIVLALMEHIAKLVRPLIITDMKFVVHMHVRMRLDFWYNNHGLNLEVMGKLLLYMVFLA